MGKPNESELTSKYNEQILKVSKTENIERSLKEQLIKNYHCIHPYNEEIKMNLKFESNICNSIIDDDKNPILKKVDDQIEDCGKKLKGISRVSDKNNHIENIVRKKIDSEIIAKGKKMKLKVMDGTAIPTRTIIKINAGGILGSKRNKQDGYSYFGTTAANVYLYIRNSQKLLLMTMT